MLRSVVAFACLAPAVAYAEPPKAWTVAKDNLPANTAIAVSVDMSTLAKTKLGTQIVPLLLATKPGFKDAVAEFQTACKLSPLDVIDSVAVGMDAQQQEGVAFIALKRLNRDKLTTCMQAVMKSMIGIAPTVKIDGNVTEIAVDTAIFNVGWIGNDVAVVSLKVNDKGKLRAWIGNKGGFAKSDVAKYLPRVNTAATAWALSTASKQVDAQTTIKVGWASAAYAGGKFGIEFHGVLEDAGQASAMATNLTEQLGKVPAGLAGQSLTDAIRGTKITASGADLIVKTSIAETDLSTVLTMLSM
jgi:hypothetical protein